MIQKNKPVKKNKKWYRKIKYILRVNNYRSSSSGQLWTSSCLDLLQYCNCSLQCFYDVNIPGMLYWSVKWNGAELTDSHCYVEVVMQCCCNFLKGCIVYGWFYFFFWGVKEEKVFFSFPLVIGFFSLSRGFSIFIRFTKKLLMHELLDLLVGWLHPSLWFMVSVWWCRMSQLCFLPYFPCFCFGFCFSWIFLSSPLLVFWNLKNCVFIPFLLSLISLGIFFYHFVWHDNSMLPVWLYSCYLLFFF